MPRLIADIAYAEAGIAHSTAPRRVTLRMDAYLPDAPTGPVPAVVLAFGGAFLRGSKEDDSFPTAGRYGANTAMPFSVHQNVDHPLSLYAASKKSNELMAHTYSHLYGLRTTGLRFFTVYGPWGRPDMALFKFTDAIRQSKPIDVYGQGQMSREFTYIDDLV